MEKHKGISRKEEAVKLNGADLGLSKSESCGWHLKYKDRLFSAVWYTAPEDLSKRGVNPLNFNALHV